MICIPQRSVYDAYTSLTVSAPPREPAARPGLWNGAGRWRDRRPVPVNPWDAGHAAVVAAGVAAVVAAAEALAAVAEADAAGPDLSWAPA